MIRHGTLPSGRRSKLGTTSQTGTGAINLTGNELAQRINGNNGANVIKGNGGNDTISGFNGNDVLYGGAGNDRLTGGAGNDSFVFNTALNTTTNVDTITDFNPIYDTIRLDNAVMSALGSALESGRVLEKHIGPRPRQQRPHHLRDRHRLAEL